MPRTLSRKKGLVIGAILILVVIVFMARSRQVSSSASGTASDTTTPAAETAAETAAEPIAVEVSPVKLATMETVVTAKGTLVAAQGASARVAVVAPGRLTQVLVREGDRVSAGQLLALVDNRAAAAGERSAAASLSASLADARQAELTTQATRSDQANALRQAQLALQTAITQRNGAIRQAAIGLRSAESDLRKAEVGAHAPDAENAVQQTRLALKAARLDRDATVQAARRTLQSAQTDLDKIRAGARPQEIKQAQANVAQAQATQDRASTEVERVQFLFDKGIKARRELDDAKTALKVAQAALQSAQDQLSLLEAGARPQELQAAEITVSGARDALFAAQQSGEAKVQQAQSALELAQGNLGQAVQQRPEDVRAARLKVAAARDTLRQARQNGDASMLQARSALQAASQGQLQIAAKTEDARSKQALASGKQADLSAAQANLAAGELRAPLSGLVTKRSQNPGDLADPANPVLEITDPTALNLVASLSAEKGSAVQPGMAVRVTMENLPGRVFAGSVSNVGQIDPQTNLLAVRIIVPNPRGILKIGAFASAEIITAVRPLAVVVPKESVLSHDGKNVVMTFRKDNKAHEKAVSLGTTRGELVEITSGLKPREEVIRAGAYQLDDGASVTVDKKVDASNSRSTP